jgi:HAD superfamily hydrolase (TIGR01509 family)
MGIVNDLFNWEKVSWPKRIAIAIPFLAAFIGWQYWSKGNDLKKNHAEMIAMCGKDTECLEAVDKYADKCFDENYHMGRRSQGVKTALLSNSWGEHYPEHLWVGAFDAVVISGRVGMRKPDAEIFQHTAELLHLEPERCVMVDDLAANIHGAVAAGMVGVLHVSYEQTVDELEVLFDLPLR